MNLRHALLALATLGTLLTAGCSKPTGRQVPIEMSNYKLSPATIEVKAGEAITFVLKNTSTADHEFESDEGKFEEVVVPAGRTRNVGWTAPGKAGEYEFECDMAGHDGMTMKINVTN